MVNASNSLRNEGALELLSLGTLYLYPLGRVCKRWDESARMDVAFLTRCLLYRVFVTFNPFKVDVEVKST